MRPDYAREGTQGGDVARNTLEDLLRLPEPPTAISAASDTRALGALEAAQALGMRVPDARR